MYDAVQALIGAVPAGFEPVVYVLCIPVLLFVALAVLRPSVGHYWGYCPCWMILMLL